MQKNPTNGYQWPSSQIFDANKANGPFDLSLKLIIKVIRGVFPALLKAD